MAKITNYSINRKQQSQFSTERKMRMIRTNQAIKHFVMIVAIYAATCKCQFIDCSWVEQQPNIMGIRDILRVRSHGNCRYLNKDINIGEQKLSYIHILLDQVTLKGETSPQPSMMILCTKYSSLTKMNCQLSSGISLFGVNADKNERYQKLNVFYQQKLQNSMTFTIQQKSIIEGKQKDSNKNTEHVNQLSSKSQNEHTDRILLNFSAKMSQKTAHKAFYQYIGIIVDMGITTFVILLFQKQRLIKQYAILHIWGLIQILKICKNGFLLKGVQIDVSKNPILPVWMIIGYLGLSMWVCKLFFNYMMEVCQQGEQNREQTQINLTDRQNNTSLAQAQQPDVHYNIQVWKYIAGRISVWTNQVSKYLQRKPIIRQLCLIISMIIAIQMIQQLFFPYVILVYTVKISVFSFFIQPTTHSPNDDRQLKIAQQLRSMINHKGQKSLMINYRRQIRQLLDRVQNDHKICEQLCYKFFSIFSLMLKYIVTESIMTDQTIFKTYVQIFLTAGITVNMLLWVHRKSIPTQHIQVSSTTKLSKSSQCMTHPQQIDGKFDACSICLSLLDNKPEQIAKTSCGHYFHILCLLEWSINNPICPIDRRKLRMCSLLKTYLNSIEYQQIEKQY